MDVGAEPPQGARHAALFPRGPRGAAARRDRGAIGGRRQLAPPLLVPPTAQQGEGDVVALSEGGGELDDVPPGTTRAARHRGAVDDDPQLLAHEYVSLMPTSPTARRDGGRQPPTSTRPPA